MFSLFDTKIEPLNDLILNKLPKKTRFFEFHQILDFEFIKKKVIKSDEMPIFTIFQIQSF